MAGGASAWSGFEAAPLAVDAGWAYVVLDGIGVRAFGGTAFPDTAVFVSGASALVKVDTQNSAGSRTRMPLM